MFVEYLHLPQNSTSPAVAAYAASELRRLAEGLEAAFGLPVTPAALSKSIDLYNAVRGQVRDLYAYRIAQPQALSTAELYAVLRAVTTAPPEDAVGWLDSLLGELPQRSARPRPRTGSEARLP